MQSLLKADKITSLLHGMQQLCNEASFSIPEAYASIDRVLKELYSMAAIDVYIDISLDDQSLDKIRNFFGVSQLSGQHTISNDQFLFHDSFLPRTKKIGEQVPACIIIFINSGLLEENSIVTEHIHHLISRHSLSFLYSVQHLPVSTIEFLNPKRGLFTSGLFASCPESLQEWSQNENLVAFLSISHAIAICSSIESILELLEISFRREADHLKVNSSINQQQAARFGKQAQSLSFVTDLMNELRTRLQNSIYLFEKGFNERMDDFLRTNDGTFFQEITDTIESLDTLEEHKSHKIISATLPEGFEKDLLNDIRTRFRSQMMSDLIVLKDHLRLMQEEIEQVIRVRNLPSMSFHVRFLTDGAIDKILSNTIHFDKPYKGERMSRRVIEYLMAARSYYMIMAMTISTFGLSFVRNISTFMIPATIILVGVGALNVYSDVSKDKESFLKKELERARELLIAECKRILGEVRKEWSAKVSQNLREQFQYFMGQIEPVAKENFALIDGQALVEKKKIQRQLQATDTQEKNLALIEKRRRLFQGDLLRIQAELQQELLSTKKSIPSQ